MQNESPRVRMRTWLIAATLLILVAVLGWWLWVKFAPPKPFGKVVTIAGTGVKIGGQATLSDPFGVAAIDDDLYVTDGMGGRIYRVSLQGKVEVVLGDKKIQWLSATSEHTTSSRLEMPSHLALDSDGRIIVANTGRHEVLAHQAKNQMTEVVVPATSANVPADAMKGPIGVASGSQGEIYIADTYRDRILVYKKNEPLRVFAGGKSMGVADGTANDALFSTPCGLARMQDGSLLVADTGNHRIRRIDSAGNVTTVAGNGDATEKDGALLEASFHEPIAIAIAGENSFYVADSAGSAIRFVNLGGRKPERPPAPDLFDAPGVYTVAGGKGIGVLDGALQTAVFNRPTSVALVGKNTLVVADSGNGLVRAIVPATASLGTTADPALATLKAEELRNAIPPRWPYEPPSTKREIAGTLGEIRGEVAPDKDAWFHNGLDIPGAYGETLYSLFTERVSLPLAVEGVGNLRERLRLPLLGYIHVRIARDQNDQPLGIKEAILQRDEKNKVIGVRIPRGTQIQAGDVVGTLNAFNHVHLIAGPSGAEVNALAALPLPGLADTIPPVIEGVRLMNEAGELKADNNQPHVINGKVQFIVRAYDQADGNAGYRRLGVYQVGYQILRLDGVALPEFKEPQFNIVFNRLPEDWATVRLAYAAPSQSGYTGRTIFDYIATNTVRDGTAQEVGLNPKLPNGDYILRAVVEDFFRNRSTKDVRIQIAN